MIKYIESNQYIHKTQESNPQGETQSIERWLGQWLIPEEVFENVFSQLSSKQLNSVCVKMLVTVQRELSLSLKNTVLDIKGGSKKESNENYECNFSTMMEKRKLIAQTIGKNIPSDDVLPCEAAQSGYPCVTFDVRNLANELKIEFTEGSPPPKSFALLNKMLMCYFCGLVNYFSMQYYGENFVWVQPQSSFGSLRPSFAETGLSFRFSPGLVPDDFYIVMQKAYRTMVEGVKDLKDTKDLFQLGEIFRSTSTAEDAQLMALLAMAEKQNKSALFEYLNKLTKLKRENSKKPKKPKPNDVRKNRENIFSAAKKAIDMTAITSAQACPEILSLRNRLIFLASQLKEAESFSLFLFDQDLIKQIQKIAEAATGSDYSKVASDIEILARLIKIKYEMNLLSKRENSNSKASSLTADDLKGLDLSPPALRKEISVDTTLSEGTFATRCGMSAYSLAYQGIYRIPKHSEGGYSMDEMYFEITTDIFEYIAKIKNLNEKEICKSAGKDKVGLVHFIDLAQFPTKPHGKSVVSTWKDSWDKIKPEDKPEILIIDITAATHKDLLFIAEQTKKDHDQKPYVIITFSSDNKFGQIGVDLVSMGELRLMAKTPTVGEIQARVKEITGILKDHFERGQEITTSARAYRKLIKDLFQRRTLKPAGTDREFKKSHLEKRRASLIDIIDQSPLSSQDLIERGQELEVSGSSEFKEPQESTLRLRKEGHVRLEQLTDLFRKNPEKLSSICEAFEKLKKEQEQLDADIENALSQCSQLS